MKKVLLPMIVAVGLAGPAVALSWPYGGFSPEAQWGGGKGRQQGPISMSPDDKITGVDIKSYADEDQ